MTVFGLLSSALWITVFAGIVVLTLCALVLDTLVGTAEKRLMRWQPKIGVTEKIWTGRQADAVCGLTRQTPRIDSRLPCRCRATARKIIPKISVRPPKRKGLPRNFPSSPAKAPIRRARRPVGGEPGACRETVADVAGITRTP
jgi:hypothetical protein